VGEDRTDRGNAEGTSYQRRVTASEAAELLGISEGAVRMRVKRGTLPSTREGGRLYVLLNTDPTTEQERPHDRTHDRTSELIATLRKQLEEANERDRENRRIIAALTSRIPAIEAPSEAEASEEAETVEEAQDDLGAERTRREMAETTLHEGMAEERRRREEAERERDELRRELHARGRQQGSYEAGEEQQGKGQPQSAASGPQGGAQPRAWWRRIIGR
jgi:excisionase family DNA binding protein